VYAVDAGHGVLAGDLRADPRVVALERTNLAALDAQRVPDAVDAVTLDLSYLALAAAIPQLVPLTLAPAAHVVALVKPVFELRLGSRPPTPDDVAAAVARVHRAFLTAGFACEGTTVPARGARGAREAFVRAWRGS
jgi:23S rRNA (cytidine1920-2'-O)/16S rRNA (cytidine1409-2'-O)-methyltransferase